MALKIWLSKEASEGPAQRNLLVRKLRSLWKLMSGQVPNFDMPRVYTSSQMLKVIAIPEVWKNSA